MIIFAYLFLIAEDILHFLDILPQLVNFLNTAENVLLIDIAQLYLCNIFSLYLVDTEAYHKVRHNVRFVFGLTDYLYSLVDVEKNFGEGFKEVELFFLLLSRSK